MPPHQPEPTPTSMFPRWELGQPYSCIRQPAWLDLGAREAPDLDATAPRATTAGKRTPSALPVCRLASHPRLCSGRPPTASGHRETPLQLPLQLRTLGSRSRATLPPSLCLRGIPATCLGGAAKPKERGCFRLGEREHTTRFGLMFV